MKNNILFRTSTRNSTPPASRLIHLRFLKVLVSLALCCLAASVRAQAPVPPPVLATITFANGQSVTIGSNDQQIFNPVDLGASEGIGIALQLPPAFVNTPVGILPMDGGFAPEEIQVGQDGSTAFAFQAGNQPGLYRIQLLTANSSVLLQFFVPNPGTP
jgi:hypothetical protein